VFLGVLGVQKGIPYFKKRHTINQYDKSMKMNKINILFLIDKTRVNRNNKAPIRCRITYLKERKNILHRIIYQSKELEFS